MTSSPPIHYCHARRCMRPVPPAMFMCRKHWYMLSQSLRDRIWATYRRGQEIMKDPSREYLKAADEAIEHVATKEQLR